MLLREFALWDELEFRKVCCFVHPSFINLLLENNTVLYRNYEKYKLIGNKQLRRHWTIEVIDVDVMGDARFSNSVISIYCMV